MPGFLHTQLTTAQECVRAIIVLAYATWLAILFKGLSPSPKLTDVLACVIVGLILGLVLMGDVPLWTTLVWTSLLLGLYGLARLPVSAANQK